MAQGEKQGRFDLSRRDFLKVGAAGAAAAATLDWAPAPAMANIKLHGTDTATNEFVTTCPYCSAQCGQIVVVGNKTGDVYDIYGDVSSPTNNGGLCAKGAGSYQLVNNPYRIGAFAGAHPEDGNTLAPIDIPTVQAAGFGYDDTYADGIAYKRTDNQRYTKMKLSDAMDEIAAALVAARGSITAGTNAKGVQFFGSSHINNEQNYLYRKIIADFGTSQVEHQARI